MEACPPTHHAPRPGEREAEGSSAEARASEGMLVEACETTPPFYLTKVRGIGGQYNGPKMAVGIKGT